MDGNDPEISAAIKEKISLDTFPEERISAFIKRCIINRPFAYLHNRMELMYDLRNTNIFVNYAHERTAFRGKIAGLLSDFFFIPFSTLYLLLVFDFIFFMRYWIRSKEPPWIKIVLWSLITGQFAVSVFGARSEYQRLFIIAIPYVILLIFSYIDLLSFAIDKDKMIKYKTVGDHPG
jgi:hypothetical protein